MAQYERLNFPPALKQGMSMQRRLHRSLTDRKLAGVCGGIAEYLGWDPTLVRVLWIVLTFLGGSGVLAYLILWLVMPDGP